MRALIPALLCALPLPAFAGPVCTFTQECFQTLACEEANYEVEVNLDLGQLVTQVQNLDIQHYEVSEQTTYIAAVGMGGMHLLTINGTRALLSVHIGAGPSVITYYGDCTED